MTRPTDYLALHGAQLLQGGYEVVPIRPGLQHPGTEDWQSMPSTPQALAGWLANGRAHDGVGVRTRLTPGLDIDVSDEPVAEAMEAWCHAHIGFAPVRVGRAPRRLLVYRAETPFRKMKSSWVDQTGAEQTVEVLADGQQFVAWAIHPKTGKPYEWIGPDSLLNIPLADLEPLTEATARQALSEFDRLAGLAGWTRRSGLLGAMPQAGAHSSDALAAVQADVVIPDDELKLLLDAVPNDDVHYDDWLNVGMALHHHYRGTDDGLELWRDWSSKSSKHVDETLDRKWPTFAADDGRPVKTARYIIMLGKAALKARASETVTGVKQRLEQAASVDDLRAAAETVSQDGALDMLARESLTAALRTAWKRLEGSPLAMSVARSMTRYKPTSADDAMPNWLKGHAYITAMDVFYNRATGERLTAAGFNAKHDRYMLSDADRLEGKKAPEVSAARAATAYYQLPTYHQLVYWPGEADEFALNGVSCINSYRGDTLPELPHRLSNRDHDNVRTVEEHFRFLIPNDRERALVLSWLAYIAQTNKRVNWAVFIQGVEGDGKSFVETLMSAVLGGGNVKPLSPRSLEEKFTAWAHGAQLAVVEEVKMHGHNRFDVLNGIKTYITNPVVTIRAMNTDPFAVPNTQSYIMLSNHTDALPLDDNDRRYCVIRSPVQTKDALAASVAGQPGYFDRLFEAVDESPGALRRWLLEYPLHGEFHPKGRAPWTAAHDYVVRVAQPEEVGVVHGALEETRRLDVSEELLCRASLAEEVERITGTVFRDGHTIHRILLRDGWTQLGRLSHRGRLRTLWSKKPELWKTPDGLWDKAATAARLDEAEI